MDKQPVFFCVCSQKGGVGKSTFTILLASWLHYTLRHDVLGGRYEYRRPQTTVISLLIMRGCILRNRCQPFRRNPLPAYHPLLVGSANNAFPLYSGRFSFACPRTVLTRLHVYGSPSVTSSYLTHLWIFALHSAHTTKVFLCM